LSEAQPKNALVNPPPEMIATKARRPATLLERAPTVQPAHASSASAPARTNEMFLKFEIHFTNNSTIFNLRSTNEQVPALV
jgi:hypothetical protein